MIERCIPKNVNVPTPGIVVAIELPWGFQNPNGFEKFPLKPSILCRLPPVWHELIVGSVVVGSRRIWVYEVRERFFRSMNYNAEVL